MSKSYHKTPYCGQKNNTFMKKEFNRRLRRNKLKELYDNGNSYRKVYQTWDICDFYTYAWNREKAIRSAYHDLEEYPWLQKRYPQGPSRKLAEYLYNRWFHFK